MHNTLGDLMVPKNLMKKIIIISFPYFKRHPFAELVFLGTKINDYILNIFCIWVCGTISNCLIRMMMMVIMMIVITKNNNSNCLQNIKGAKSRIKHSKTAEYSFFFCFAFNNQKFFTVVVVSQHE